MTQGPPKDSRHLLETPLTEIRGVGPRIAEKLAKLGVNSVEDALYMLPFRYEDRREFRKISQLREGIHEVFFGKILASGEVTTSRSRRRIFEVIVGDDSGQVSLKWFHYRKPWIANQYAVGRKAVVSGEVKRFGSQREVHHPETELLDKNQCLEDYQSSDPMTFGRILPVYPLTEGLNQYSVRKIWKQVVDQFAGYVHSAMPEDVYRTYGLMKTDDALKQVHWPNQDADFTLLNQGRDPARRSLVFDEFFFLELGMALRHQGVMLEKGLPFSVNHLYTKPLAEMLPYRMTNAQRRVLGEIKRDLISGHPMNRLVQGDVGCGKTIVALMTALVAIENNTQVAIVAPTEILAEQHFVQFHPWLDKLGLKTAFLRSKMPPAEKKQILSAISAGSVHLVVGTHAVLQDGVTFNKLGLGIVDEQHRFGVKQRAVLRSKGENPHVLVMTATPIPRTLSLTFYGDLSLSVIDQMPPGRMPVKTRVVPVSQRNKVYDQIRTELSQGHQVYVVYPLVEETERSDLLAATEGAEHLKNNIMPEASIGLLHGRMNPEEKESVMRRFKEREIDILVATTVIEVGIDVPNATLIIVEHAERFGLAQLHQLRGRVGRGQQPGQCLLMKSLKCSDDGQKRLDVMSQTNDGFRIAEADLEIRGPGEFLGVRQSGLPDFRVANILRDGHVLDEARHAAFQLVADRPDFHRDQHMSFVYRELLHRWGKRLELARVG
ncbi:MAG: ATP-dependent DNA helicase RecG [Deltaproteobacteria bacterium]|jgi:ATP-dependent DNA helicase RecG|nr:ATP-dependent DNA helicase RecG [Deltaproteobacteria bacterium]